MEPLVRPAHGSHGVSLAPGAFSQNQSQAGTPASGSFFTHGTPLGSVSGDGGNSPRTDDADEHFRVVIRVRPPLERELASPVWQDIVSISNNAQVTLQEVIPDANVGDRAMGSAQFVNSHSFTFDQVYSQESSQPYVYETTARASVMSALQGYNATILAYGPTGTGKTYTMGGHHNETLDGGDGCGIIPRSMEDIFQHIKDYKGPQSRFLVRASYLQIYNEVVSDLLKPDRTHLVVREDQRRGVFVEGLSEWLCRSPAEVHTLMERGSVARATAQTASNDASSRSHAVFIVVVEQCEMQLSEKAPSGANEAEFVDDMASSDRRRLRVGRLNLVDLAGSERPRLTGATGQRLEETKKINQSLSALGNVISALTERRGRQHVPYRDSKLTRLLEDSLGGNCRTTMMAMVSPAAEAFGESLSTLKFAHRAKSIRNTAHVNEDVDQGTLLRRYEAELKRLRLELRTMSSSRGTVDKRQLLEMDEERRIAEENCVAAVSAFQERGFVLQQEKAEKQQLEERIRQMASQLLSGGGRQISSDQERIESEYAAKLSELERERSTIEDDKAQVARYKQLLLKQRDIMIALTQRLHERDQTIISLQDELDVRDRRIAELEELPEFMTVGMMESSHVAARGRRFPSENAVFDVHDEMPMNLLTAEEKIVELTAALDSQRRETHRLTVELDETRDPISGRHSTASTNCSLAGNAALVATPCRASSDANSWTLGSTRGKQLAGYVTDTIPTRNPMASVGPASRSTSQFLAVAGLQPNRPPSPAPHCWDGSMAPTPEGSVCGSTRSEQVRGRRPCSQERIPPYPCRPRSGTLHSEQFRAAPHGIRPGGRMRASSLGAVAGTPSTSTLGSSCSTASAASAATSISNSSMTRGYLDRWRHSAPSSNSRGLESRRIARSSATTEASSAPSTPHARPASVGPDNFCASAPSSCKDMLASASALVAPTMDASAFVGTAGATAFPCSWRDSLALHGVGTTPGVGSLYRSPSVDSIATTSSIARSSAPPPPSAATAAVAAAAAAARMHQTDVPPSVAVAAVAEGGFLASAPSAPSATAKTLREEAQRSVDALLARRRSELKRIAATGAVTASSQPAAIPSE